MIEYSETERPSFTARSRSATLWSFEPVKCWSRLPYDSGGTTRRSNRSPSSEITVAFVSPCATTSSTNGSATNCAVSAAGSLEVAITSRSRKVSLRRRMLPASETLSTSGLPRRASTTASTAGSPLPSSGRTSAGSRSSASAFRIFSSLRAPRPGIALSFCCSAAAFSSASVVSPSSCQRRAAVFGPSPGRCMKSTTSGGTCALRLVSASISPVSTIWTIFSSIVLPIPGSSFARPSSASCAIEPAFSRTRCAARRYAITRNDASPVSSSMSARSSSWSATSLFRGRVWATQRS